MKNRVLLFLSANQFQARIWRDGGLDRAQTFPDNQEGREQFGAFLRTTRSPVFLLTDLIEEDFRHETVLHLRGRERAEQVQRKFEQFYRNTPFRQAALHQRQSEGRHDDEMLFSALTNPALVQTWLDIMLQQHVPLAGIYSAPGISKPLVEHIHADHVLLLSWEKGAGLRQTYFNEKRLYLSRLTPVGEDQSFCDVIATEAVRTQQYLKSLSLLPLGQTLQVHIICNVEDRRELQSKLLEAGDISYAYLDIQKLGEEIGSKDVYPDSDATGLLLHLLATKPPASHYANAEHIHYFNLWRSNKRLLWLSVATATAAIMLSLLNLWQGSSFNNERTKLDHQAQKLTQRTREIIQAFPAQLAPAADMKSVVTSLRKLDSFSPPPEEVWAGLGATLQEFPRLRIDHLSWQTGSGRAAKQNAGFSPTASVIRINGQLEDWDDGYRNSLNYLDRFQQALQQRHYRVVASKLPLDISSSGSIADNALEGDGNPANFSLRLIWEQTP